MKIEFGEGGTCVVTDKYGVVVHPKAGDKYSLMPLKQVSDTPKPHTKKKRAVSRSWFLWVRCEPDCPLMADLTPENLFRLLFAATFAGKDGKLETADGKHVALRRCDLMERMGVTNKVFNAFMRDVIGKGYIIHKGNEYWLNHEKIVRGGDVFLRDERTYARVFANPVRKLYAESTTYAHHMIGYAYRLLPYRSYAGEGMSVDEIGSAIGVTPERVLVLRRKWVSAPIPLVQRRKQSTIMSGELMEAGAIHSSV